MLKVDDELIGILIIDCYSWRRLVILQTLLSFKVNLSISKSKLCFIDVILLLFIFEQNRVIFGVRNFGI